MTTSVSIQSSSANSEDVLIQVMNNSGTTLIEHRVTSGHSKELYVYSGQHLVISEVPNGAQHVSK